MASDSGERAQTDHAAEPPARAPEPKPKNRRPILTALSTRNSFAIGFLGTLGVLVALLLGGMINDSFVVITYVAAGLFLAMGLEPLIRLLGRAHIPRPAAIAIVFVGLVALLAGILFLIIPAMVSQVQTLAGNGPRLVKIVAAQHWFKVVNSQFSGFFSESLKNITGFFSDPNSVLNLAGGVLSVGASIANGIGGSIIVLVLTLYFMASLNGIKSGFASLIPASRRQRFTDLINRIFDNVGKYVMSQAIIAGINAICAYIVMSILQIGFREVLAVLVFLLAILPLVGSIAAATLVVVVTLITQTLASPDHINLWPVLIIAVYYIIYMQVEAYVLTPRIVNRAIPLPGAVVVIAALLGGTLMGVFGALLAIPVAASILLLIRELWIPYQDQR
ncbi:MAG: AI-2E family transporter [Microbacteriaceae bacterium]|jgi:predicted PurR-regulated permease PerM|nr:AI-2E family transporter [Microbacteriaceae bacterium]MCI1207147.1 AI-2E family transporter [Microbacteriaceae bacterium]